jgi:hypothetical protein
VEITHASADQIDELFFVLWLRSLLRHGKESPRSAFN